MKDLTIVLHTEKGARYVMMPSEFHVVIEQSNDIIVDFREIGTGNVLHSVFLFVEDDEENHVFGFSNFSEKGQKQILEEMRTFIIDDINKFLTEDHDNPFDVMPIKHRTYFDHQEFENRWYTFYDMVTDNIDAGEYSESDFIKPKKRNKKK